MEIKAGEIIRARRTEKNIPLVEFAREVGISPGYLSQLENGRKANPKLEIMTKIAQLLDIEIETLLGLEQVEGQMPALRMPALLRLTIARERNIKVLENKDVQKKISSIIDRAIDGKYMLEDDELYNLFLEDIYIQIETTLKRYMSMQILKNS